MTFTLKLSGDEFETLEALMRRAFKSIALTLMENPRADVIDILSAYRQIWARMIKVADENGKPLAPIDVRK
jgi:septum formation topological specificity factor MinE